MNKLKQILQKNKPIDKITNNKTLKIKQEEQFWIQKQKQQKIDEEKSVVRLKELEDYYEYDHKRKIIKLNEQGPNEVEEDIKIIGLSQQEIKQKLRQMHQPIRLFGESEQHRLKRLNKISEFHVKHPQYDMRTYDEEFQLKIKQQQYFTELDAKYRNRLIEPRLGEDQNYIKKKMHMILEEKDGNYVFENVCDQVYLWINKVLSDWHQRLDLKYTTEEQKNNSHVNYTRYQESQEELKGLLVVLKKKGGDHDMITSVYHIMNCCLVREYIKANDKYIDLSIGKAPWPMGVAMLSITVKRNAQKLSHVLTNQMTRRWMQAIKRLISVSQELYPNQDKTKMAGYSVNSML